MKREEYSVTFTGRGFQPKTIPVICNLDGWYIGNILLGGLIGMLIVDPASGAMYKFSETTIHADLKRNNGNAVAEEMELRIIDINQVPKGVELVRIN